MLLRRAHEQSGVTWDFSVGLSPLAFLAKSYNSEASARAMSVTDAVCREAAIIRSAITRRGC